MILNHLRYLFFFLSLSVLHCYSQENNDTRSHIVMVSIAPYKFFIDQIAQNTVKINLIVPPGASFHTYEPSARQILEGGKADIWFRIGELFEQKILQAIKSHYPKMKIVDLRNDVDLILVDPNHKHCCGREGADLHIWLSPKMVKIQAQQITDALISTYPEHEALYRKNLAILLERLDALNNEIEQVLKPLKNRIFMVSHGAYAYLARDFDLTQWPIEFEGKDPSPRQLTEILLRARAAKIKTIFVQNQYSSKGASLIAQELGARLETLDPYSGSGNYFEAMLTIAQRIAAKDQETP